MTYEQIAKHDLAYSNFIVHRSSASFEKKKLMSEAISGTHKTKEAKPDKKDETSLYSMARDVLIDFLFERLVLPGAKVNLQVDEKWCEEDNETQRLRKIKSERLVNIRDVEKLAMELMGV